MSLSQLVRAVNINPEASKSETEAARRRCTADRALCFQQQQQLTHAAD